MSPGHVARPSWPTTCTCSSPVGLRGASAPFSEGSSYPVPGMATVMHRGHTIHDAMSALMYVAQALLQAGNERDVIPHDAQVEVEARFVHQRDCERAETREDADQRREDEP